MMSISSEHASRIIMTYIPNIPDHYFEKVRALNILPVKVNAPEEALAAGSIAHIAENEYYHVDLLQRAVSQGLFTVISRPGTGRDGIPRDAERMGITVTRTPHSGTDSVVEDTVGLMEDLVRHNTQKYLELVFTGKWDRSITRSLHGMKVGIVGLGEIGTAVAEHLHKVYMCQLACYTHHTPDAALLNELDMRPMELDQLCEWADMVSLHCPLTRETENLIQMPQLEKIGPHGFVVNLARGGIINEADLETAVLSHMIEGVALDVFSEEPLSSAARPFDRLLTELKADPSRYNVLLTPHNAACTDRSKDAAYTGAIDNCLTVLKKKGLVTFDD